MRRRRRRIKFISIVFALLAVGIIVFVMIYILDTENSSSEKFQFTDSSAESVLSEISYKTYDSKGKEITLSSKKITEEKKDNYLFENMTSNFQLSDGESGSVSSDKTKLIRDDKTICEFFGNVKFTTSSGLVLKTEKSIVDFNKKTAVGNTDISIEKDGLQLSSNGYLFDINNNIVTLTGNVRGFLYQRDVGSDNASLPSESYASAIFNAETASEKENASGATICCNKIVIHFMRKKDAGNLSKSVKSIDAIGNASCTSPDYTLTAKKNILYQRDVGSDNASLPSESYASTIFNAEAASKIIADSNVTLRHKSDGSTVYCDKMVINLDGDNLSDMKSVKSIDATGNAKCTSPDYTLTAAKILYQRGVTKAASKLIADSKVTFICKKSGKTFDIRSGHMIATLDGKGSIEEVEATNSLIIKTANATIRSSSGVLRDNKIMASGSVAISSPEGDIFGETAVFDINTGGISVSKSSGVVTDGKKLKK
ncbi:hypothetical protein FACS189472_03230 [Alphaproteobacteria bacterium]|nr:hypothetical protein FACS189472_03230 [Alphaproteobacteria bacterium]